MSRLPRSVPGFSSMGALPDGAVVDDITINRWQIEQDSITGKHIAPGSITAKTLQVGMSTTIDDGSVTTEKIAAGAVTGDRIAANSISGSHVQANAITAANLSVSQIASISDDMGIMVSGSLILSGGMTISTQAGGGVPTGAGIYIGESGGAQKILLKDSGGVVTVELNGSNGSATFKGDVTCNKIIVTANALNTVNFGADITIGGDIVMNATSLDGRVRFDGAGGSKFIDYDAVYGSTSAFGLVDASPASTSYIGIAQGSDTWIGLSTCPRIDIEAGSIVITAAGSGGPSPTTRDVSIAIGTNSGNVLSLKRGTTTVLSFAGNANTVTLAGDLILAASRIGTGAADPTGGANGDIYLCTGTNSGLWHKKAGTWTRL